jgi:hypothetical protein
MDLYQKEHSLRTMVIICLLLLVAHIFPTQQKLQCPV